MSREKKPCFIKGSKYINKTNKLSTITYEFYAIDDNGSYIFIKDDLKTVNPSILMVPIKSNIYCDASPKNLVLLTDSAINKTHRN